MTKLKNKGIVKHICDGGDDYGLIDCFQCEREMQSHLKEQPTTDKPMQESSNLCKPMQTGESWNKNLIEIFKRLPASTETVRSYESTYDLVCDQIDTATKETEERVAKEIVDEFDKWAVKNDQAYEFTNLIEEKYLSRDSDKKPIEEEK